MANAIKINILGDAKGLTSALTTAKAQLSAFGIAANKGKLLAGGAALGIAGLGIAAVQMGMEIKQAEKDFALSTGLIGEDLDDAFSQVMDAAGQVPDSFDVVATAAGNLQTTTGFLGDDLEGLTVQFLDLNRLGFGALNENQVGEMFQTWGLEGQAATDQMDMLAQVSQATGVDIGMLSDLVTSNAGAFMKWGLDAEEAVQMLGQWEKAGIDSNKVVRGLNSNIDMLESQGKDTTKMLDDMTKVMDDGNISAEEATLLYDLFGAEATDVIAQLEAGTITLSDFDKQMGLSGQTTEEMAAASATVGEKFSELRNRIMVKLYPALLKLGDVVIQVVDWMLINFPKGLAVIQAFTQDAIKFFTGLWESIEGTVNDFIAIVTGLWETFGGDILRYITTTWENVQQYLEGALEVITGIFQGFKAAFTGDWKGLWKSIRKVFSGAWKMLTAAVKQAFNGLRLLMAGILKGAIPVMRTLAVNLGNAIKDKVKEKIEDVKGFFRDLPGDLLRIGVRIANAAGTVGKNLGSGVLNGIKDGLIAAAGFAGDVASGVLSAVKNLLNTYVIDKINSAVEFTIPGPGPLPDIRINPPDIPRLRHGGSFRGMALVGEDGPELLRGASMGMGGGTVMSRREKDSSIGPMGGGITVNVYGSDATPEAIAAAVAWKMRRVG